MHFHLCVGANFLKVNNSKVVSGDGDDYDNNDDDDDYNNNQLRYVRVK
jgi:hypothetical protein